MKTSWSKLMAHQLRKPSGLLARLAGKSMNKANVQLYQLTLNNLNVKDGDTVLEIGFGNGFFFGALNSMANNLKISGIEYSPEMVSEAIWQNKKLIHSNSLNVSVGSSDLLPFANHSFDKIYCINVVYFWENPSEHLQEIYRVLKPGGQFCIGLRPKDNLATFEFSRFGFILYTEDEISELLTNHGFQFLGVKNARDSEPEFVSKGTPF